MKTMPKNIRNNYLREKKDTLHKRKGGNNTSKEHEEITSFSYDLVDQQIAREQKKSEAATPPNGTDYTTPTAVIALNSGNDELSISAMAPLTGRSSGLDPNTSLQPFTGMNGADISAILPNKSDISCISTNN